MNTPEEFFDNIGIVARRLDVYAVADKLDWHWDNDCRSPAISQAADMLRRMARYEYILQQIANERIELSHDKIKWQCEDHIRWAKEVLK